RSREMAAYVGYDAMYRDGIAQVMPGMFSQTVEFSDISYQSARKEARETAFTVMSSLFNYFPADSHVQLQVVNAPIPADEVGRKVFFEPGERATAGLAEEYNRILNDKMREGVSNLVRHRYLTYAVGADDVDAAVPKLARIRGDVEQTLARIRCSSRALDGAERLELLQGQLRPGSRFEFSWDKLSPTSGARTKDFVMPSTLDFKPEGRSDCFRSDGRYGAVLAVRSFGSVIEETYLASIIDLPLPLNVTLHVQPIAQSEALALVKRQIDWMDKEIIDEQMSAVKKGYDYQILPPELRFSKEEAEELLDFLRNKSERLFVYTGLVYTWADSLEELDRRVQQVTSVAQGCTIGLEPLHFRQRQALNSVLPLGDNHVTVSRYLTTGQVAMQMPFASQSLDEAGGGYYGQSKESGNLVLCDRKRLASPMGFVCGKPGSGKSFSVKREITNTVLAHPEDEVVIFDPAGEYGNLVGALGGANVELAPGCSAVLNPLDTADVADRADAAKLAYKTDAVLALSSALMAEGREGLPERDRSIIARCVGEAYRECARDGRLPTLGDFHAALLAQPEPEAADIALRYERYVKGAFSFFNGQSNVALDNRITNIDMHGLGQNMRVFGMITALEMVRNRVMVTPPRPNYTWLYIDEVQSLFAHPTVVEYFARLWREGRKFGLICTGISQNTSHMLANAEARDMVLNSEFFLLHKQSTADLDAWAEMLQLSATERGYIGDAVKPGEGLLISAGIRVPITDDFPKGPLYDLWNTKPAEVAEREMRRARERRRSNRGSSERGRRDARGGRGAATRRAHRGRRRGDRARRPGKRLGGSRPARRGGRPRRNGEGTPFQARRAGRRTRGQIVPTRRRPARGGSDALARRGGEAGDRPGGSLPIRRLGRARGRLGHVRRGACGQEGRGKAAAEEGEESRPRQPQGGDRARRPKGGVRGPEAAGATAPAKHQAAQAAAQASGEAARAAGSKGAASAIAGAVSGAAPALLGAAAGIVAFVACALAVAQLLSALFWLLGRRGLQTGPRGAASYITYEMVEAALECQEEYGHPAGCTIAQIIQESGQGDRMSQLAERDHNLFGMKWWSGYAGCPEVAGKANWATSEEYVPGEHTQITASFIRFTGDAECIRFRSRVFLQAERYSGNALIREAIERHDSDRMAEGLKDAGWATDSSYVESLKSIMAQWGLYRLDSMTVEDLKDSTANGNAIVEAAYSQLGVPYVWGGSTPGKALDCSGLTQYCYAQAGIRISHYTGSQYEELRRIPLSEAKPGDILYRSGHVAIYIGDDRYIHEPRTGDVCRIASGIGSFSCALTAR
ncbi:MAG: VirB4-like conjugal transfer ATPase, CD1110 family, partial [Eggerthella lenta]